MKRGLCSFLYLEEGMNCEKEQQQCTATSTVAKIKSFSGDLFTSNLTFKKCRFKYEEEYSIAIIMESILNN